MWHPSFTPFTSSRAFQFEARLKSVKFSNDRGVGSTVACESALRSAGTLLSRVRAPLPAPWPDGGPESLRSRCCGLAMYKNLKLTLEWQSILDLSGVQG
ncbi:hypothetical protein PoB_000584700 [Plakobranchus ocellatus]|uniref:Uncharacterized protein n=1 Tax=Plakobranchus ocellatus TaxID=259542 RepID=A0AAV3YB54_9GAST|nr:hypothetical protein PoB_000584700 [Plakobranchus ocellatus]